MSRIGEAPILIAPLVTVQKERKTVVVNGPKGSLKMEIDPQINVEIEGGEILVKRKLEEKRIKAMHGLTRNLIANMITGVTAGWTKNLELVGVGFRAAGSGSKLTLNVGFSHPVEIEAPEGISFEVLDNIKIRVCGIDKQLVGQVAANIKKVRPPDVYKGKGIRYQGEYIRKKLGKSGKVGATGAAGAK
ncbi:50S ribosomal protein L6 [Candidatus Daviesbacteria bacterium]|nr:50S ribosomal protein L6 [Candidatus Daviesbacteria bacterium]